MNETVEMLNDVYKNAKIGEESMGTLLKVVEDTTLKRDILTQMEGYTSLEEKACRQLKSAGRKPEAVGRMEKMMVNGGVKMNTMTNRSPTHIAEMLIQGSTMGIINAKESLSRYPGAGQEAVRLAEEIVQFEQNNIERLKEYL